MKEYMLRILNDIDHLQSLSNEQNHDFLNACKVYIEKLKNEGKLIAAQPLIKEGWLISKVDGEWQEIPFNETKEVQVGYYHILAVDIDDAIEIAKGNPEFEFTSNARIEVRPIKTKEINGFVYPHKNS